MFWLLLALLSILWAATGFLVGLLLSLALIPLRKPLNRLTAALRRLSRRSRPPVASTQPPDPDSLDGVELVDDEADLDAWANAQVDDAYIDLTRDYLDHCYSLDPTSYDHRNRSNPPPRDSRDQH